MVMKYNQSEDQNVGGVHEGFLVGPAPEVLCLEMQKEIIVCYSNIKILCLCLCECASNSSPPKNPWIQSAKNTWL